MTQVDFYVLQAADSLAQNHFACRLIEKAVKQGNNVLVKTTSEHASEELNELLWTFKPESYIPHTILTDHCDEDLPVVISHDRDDNKHHDVLVNLRAELPPHFSRFKRLAEIVIQDNLSLSASRKNFSFYKERGYPINTHKIGSPT